MTDNTSVIQPCVVASSSKGRGKNKEFQVIRLLTAFSAPSAGKNNSSSEVLQNLVEDITSASCVEDQIVVIKKISSDVTKAGLEYLVDMNYMALAVHLYLSAPLKHPAKCALTKTFNVINQNTKEPFVLCLEEGLKTYILFAMSSQDLSNYSIVASSLIGCYENLLLGPYVLDMLVLDLLQFLNKALDLCYSFLGSQSAPVLKVEINKLTHAISRIIIHALQREKTIASKDCESGKAVLGNILKISVLLMNSSEVPLDTRTNLGFVVVLIVECLEGFNGVVQLLDKKESVRVDDEMSLLCICSGLLSGLKSDQLEFVHNTTRKTIIACILDIALFVNEQSIQESNIILALWRVVQQWTRILTLNRKLVLCLETAQVTNLLNYIWGLLDHYMDNVRHLARGILENIMQLHDNFLSIGIDLGDKTAEAVLLTPETKRSRYVILSTMTAYFSTSEIFKKIPDVINNLLTAMQYPAMSSHVSGAFVAMSTTDFMKMPYAEWYKVWVIPLFGVMHKFNSSENTALEETLSKIIRLCPSVINEVLADVNCEENLDLPKLKLLLTCMKISRKLGVLSAQSKSDEDGSLWSGTIPIKVLESSLCHECDEIRISALALIVDTNRSTEAICPTDFMLIKLFLKYNVNSEVPSFRQQTLAFVSKLLTRMKDSNHTLHRSVKNMQGEIKSSEILQNYKEFVCWILLLGVDNLRVGSNYSRRICSLKILTLVFDILKNDSLFKNNVCQLQMWTKENALTLLGVILIDSYEENKAMATKILISFPVDVLGLNKPGRLQNLFFCGCALAASIHPSDCISAAYLLELCCRVYTIFKAEEEEHSSLDNIQSLGVFDAIKHLKGQLEKEAAVAEHDILHAACAGPMHGTLSCIRHLFQLVPDFSKFDENLSWKKLIEDLLNLCFKVDEIVSPVVNSSSPEGHLPMDLNQGFDLLESGNFTSASSAKVTAQMVLLCSWRTVKEVSLLLGKLSDCCPIIPDANGLLNENQILAIGVHLTTLLEETKHRGAFEQAYVGFNLLAARLWRHKKKRLQELPQKWLNDLMNAIQGTEPSLSKLCATRRSAGVPFMVQALVSAEPQNGAGLPSLQWTMSQLLVYANDEVRHVECRTHALNILRALFRHAPLAQHVAPYIAQGVIVAVSGFRGKTWAERNSATLLFSSLMTRIFGVRRSREELSSRNKMTGRVFFHRYPELYEFLLSELKRAVNALTHGDVSELAILHPILLLIARLYPSPLEGTDTPMQLNTFVPFVYKCANNSVLKTRVLAANAIVPLITANIFVNYVDDLIQQAVSCHSENLTHGLALQVVYLISNSSILNDNQLSILITHLETWVSKLLVSLSSPYSNPVWDVFLQIIELIMCHWYSTMSHSSLWIIVKQKLLNILLSKAGTDFGHKVLLGQSIFEARATRVLMCLLVLGQENDFKDLILELLRHSHFEVVLETLVVLERLMRDNSQEANDEVEGIIPDVNEGGKHWQEQLPASSVSTFCSNICRSDELSPMLLSLSMSQVNVLGRLALRVLVHITPAMWCHDVDLEQLLLLCEHPHEGTSCAAFACFSSFLQFVIQSNDNIPASCEFGCKLLKSYCTEDKGVVSRTVAVKFLLQHRQALESKYSFLSDETVSELWICTIRLICDDHSHVRSQAAMLSQVAYPSVPQKALEALVDEFVTIMKHSPHRSLATLLALALGPLPNLCSFEVDEDRVFEKGETNMFIEHEVLTDLASKHIKSHVSNETRLSGIEWNWIWTAIGGTPQNEIASAESLFESVRQRASEINPGTHFLLPPSVACSLRRLYKVQIVYYNMSKVHFNDCLPFNYDKLFCSLPST